MIYLRAYKIIFMKPVKVSSFPLILLIGFVAVGTLSVARPAFAVTPEEVTQISERLKSDSGALAAAAELAGADSELFDKFQTGVKYGEFASRLWQGDYWGVAVDFVKFKLGEEWDELTDYATGKAFSKGAQRLLGVFTALKDLGEWTGNKALDMQFSAGVKTGWQTYKENVSQSDLQEMMVIWWIQYGKNAKLNELGDVFVWKEKFAKVYALQKQVEEKPIAPEEIAKVQKEIKKTAVVSFFKLKYPGIGSNVSEELADAIVNKVDPAAIEKIAEKYKNHLAGLTAAGAEGGAVSSSDICEGIEDEQKDCLAKLQELIEKRNKVLSNEITYAEYSKTAAGIRPGAAGVAAYAGMPKEGSAHANNLINFKKSQESIIASAYEFQFGQEIRAINDSLTTNKDAFQSLKSNYKNLPGEGDHQKAPSYRVSVNTGFVGFFNNVYNTVFHYGSFDYEDFKSGAAQKNYDKYLDTEPKAIAADNLRINYLKTHLAEAKRLIGDLTFLQNRINSLISSAESTKLFAYGPANGRATTDDLKKMVSEIEGLKEDIQSGEKYLWMWRNGEWSIDSTSEAVKEMESDKKARESSIDQLKKEYASTLKTYEGEEEQRRLEKQKQAEEEKIAAEEKEAAELQKQKAEEEAWNKEKERMEAEKQAATEKARLDQETEKFNVPFGESQNITPDKTTPTAIPAQTVTPQTKPTLPPTQPSTQTKSNLPSGYSYVPAETVEMSGFSFSTQNRADMGTSDFFWNDIIYTVNGALDMGSKTLNDITSVPTVGYDQQPKPELGHVYAIKTRDGTYGIIQIALVDESDGKLHFFWRYQPDGSNSFTSTKSTLTPAPTQAPAEKTAEPIQCSIFNSNYSGGNPDGCPVGMFIAAIDILTIVNISGNSVTFEDSAKKQTTKNSGDTMQVASNATAVVKIQNGKLYFDNVVIY